VFTQWTALCLAVENGWGGDGSVDKANGMIQDVIDWFYGRKGGHVCAACREQAAAGWHQREQRAQRAGPPLTPSMSPPCAWWLAP
jgi:hypothetical protein